MSSRRFDMEPSYKVVDSAKDRLNIEKEIMRILPGVEVSLEGSSEISVGQIIDWDQKRKLITVRWEHITPGFAQKTDSETGLRAYFKCTLFSTQLVFKTTTIRRLEDGDYHYRLPDFMFKKQKRGALRVPLVPESAMLETADGTFELIDLSVGGARLKMPADFRPTSFFARSTLVLNGKRISPPDFEVKVLRRERDFLGCKFTGLNEENKTQIKQFLIDALRIHFKETI